MRLGCEGASKDGTNTYLILMVAKHLTKPYHGIQFCPESVCSQPSARQVIAICWDVSKDLLRLHKPARLATIGAESPNAYAERSSEPFKGSSLHNSPTPLSSLSEPSSPRASQELFSINRDIDCLTLPRIWRGLCFEAGEFVLLDSEVKPMPSLGDSSNADIVELSTL